MDTDAPSPRRLARHSRIIGVDNLPRGTAPSCGTMYFRSSQEYRSACPGTQAWPLGDPPGGIRPQPDLPTAGVGPLPRHQLRLDQRERPLGIARSRIGLRPRTYPSIRTRIPDLVPARPKLAHVAETPMAVLVGH